MKKDIPAKVANKVITKLLAENQNRIEGDWAERTLYKPGTAKISNKFFKNKITSFTYKCRCEWCLEGKLASNKRKIEKLKDDLNDYLQQR